MNLIIRPEQASDIDAIRQVTVAAFLHAAHTNHAEQKIVEQLRQAGALTLSLVAELAGAMVGHVAISPVQVTDGASDWYGLGPLSVDPRHQGQRIGSSLTQFALQRLREQSAAGCVVLGDPAYYSRFGFRTVPQLLLPNVPPAYFQALSFGPSLPQGLVTYHAAFDATG